MKHYIPQSLKIATTLCMAVVLSACSIFDSEDEVVLEPKPLVDFEETINIEEVWSKQIGDGVDGHRYVKLVPAIDGGKLFVCDIDGEVYSLNSDSGKENWSIELDEKVMGGVAAGYDKVFIGTQSGELVALSQADGSELWRAQLSSEILAPAATDGTVVVVHTKDDKLIALDINNGEQVWIYEGSQPILSLQGTSTPLIVSGAVFSGFADGEVKAFVADRGFQIWKQKVAVPKGRNELERMVDIDGPLLLSENKLYAVSFQGNAVAMDPRSGGLLWQQEASSYGGLAQGFGNLYMSGTDGHITALDQETGDTQWTQTELEYRKVTPPAAHSNYIAVGDYEGYVHFLSQLDGQFAGRIKVDGDGIQVAPQSDGVLLFVYGRGGELAALKVGLKEED
ncbi:outer membrane protein assembly factor BamB [Zooshikella harenae]|uniref:Outer membrane protein assembly factor BamB n=1 Tax=Zooshikella harenae TaxID=2827238 RepID=A0ABS5Z7E5_9GAMM|nr:outer membrane protein assembly factor BamB [Zooshikella harenae]MBU2709967.1 outer membrane protein assembly factor BamB [Zooshikella harenae]